MAALERSAPFTKFLRGIDFMVIIFLNHFPQMRRNFGSLQGSKNEFKPTSSRFSTKICQSIFSSINQMPMEAPEKQQ